jgi:hypothetical protein
MLEHTAEQRAHKRIVSPFATVRQIVVGCASEVLAAESVAHLRRRAASKSPLSHLRLG